MDQLEPKVLDYLRELIACQSVNPPGLETGAAEYVAQTARALGATVSLPEAASGRNNVVARWKFGDGPKNLMLHAHLDVVPPSGKWTDDPFAMSVKNGKAYGRGACDTKGSLAAMLTAVEMLLKEDTNGLNGTLTILGVVGEETGGIGTQHFLRTSEVDSANSVAVVGEPTNLDVVVAHKGISRRKVTFSGKAGHASEPEKAENAIYKAAQVAVAIKELNRKLSQNPHPLVGPPCVSATVIHGGVKDNVIPDNCELSIDRRRIPGEDDHQLDRELRAIMDGLSKQGDPVDGKIEVLGSDKEPTSIDGSHPFVQLVLGEVNNALKTHRSPEALACGTDMPFLIAAGVPTVVLGPGAVAQAHTVDEFVEISQVVAAVGIYAAIARKVLV
ncbi:MAG: M20 family metallopeptidase [Bacillota bacterium]